MSSRNTFVTSFMYHPETLIAVESALKKLDIPFTSLPHIVTGVLGCAGGMPYDNYKALIAEIDSQLSLLINPEYVEVVVVGDDDKDILFRDAPFGLALYDSKD